MNALRQIWQLAANDLRLTFRDRTSFIWMLILPIAFMWMFGRVGGGYGDVPKVALTVENHDGGWLAASFVEELEDEGITLRFVDLENPELGPDNPVRTLVIPEGFTVGALAGEEQELRLEKSSEANRNFSLAAEVHVIRAIGRTLSRLIEMETLTRDANDDDRTAEFRELGQRPDLVELAVSSAGAGQAVPRGFAMSIPGTLTMIVLMMTLIYGAVFLTLEKQGGVLRRLATLPVTRNQIFLGKLAGRLLVAGFQIVALLILGPLLFDFSWGGAPLGLTLLLVSYAFSVAGLATFLGAVLSSPEQASGVGWILSMVLAAIGGCWWPSEVMPGWLRTVSHAQPTAWAMDGFHALVSFGKGMEAVLLPSAVLLGFGALFAYLGSRFLRYD